MVSRFRILSSKHTKGEGETEKAKKYLLSFTASFGFLWNKTYGLPLKWLGEESKNSEHWKK